MGKKARQSRTDDMLTLFQNKKFTLFFFLGVFTLLGGIFYFMQSNAASYKSSVSISTDGCVVTAVGSPGDIFEYGAFSDGKGGSETTVIPSSGTTTALVGGSVGMTSYGKISRENKTGKSRLLASASQAITVDCSARY